MTNNLGKTGKTLAALLAIAALFALSFPISSCKNFMKSDDDVKEQMQQEVDVANAPEVSVRVQSSSDSLGSVTPNGPSTFKVNVPSSILASELSGGFIKWSAFYSGDLTTEAPGAVTFADPKAKETQATVLAKRSDIVIQAMFENRPTVATYFPDPIDGDSYKNAPIQINFTKPINETSLGLASGVSSGSTTALKNIAVLETFAGVSTDITTSKYTTFTLSTDKKTLALILPKIESKYLVEKYKVGVTISKDIADSSGLSMASDYTFTFKVGADIDAVAPILGEIAAGPTTSYLFDTSDAEKRRIGNVPVYVRLRGSDTGGGVAYAEIIPTLTVYSSSGAFQKDVTYATKVVPWVSNSGTPTEFTVAELARAGIAEDGLITLSVQLIDVNQNKATPSNYSFVRDTTPPPVDDPQLARIALSGSASSGYYNKNSTITFAQANYATNPILDAGSGSAPRLNAKPSEIKYRFGFNSESFTSWTAWTAVTSSVGLPISSYGSAENPSVPVYVQLMDDLGNTSAVATVKNIAIDNTPPTGTVSYDFPKSNGIWVYNTVTNVPFILAPTDNLSGVASYYISETNTPPSAGTTWTPYIASNPKGTITFSDASEGKKTCYVWFKDNAENISIAPTTAELVRDTQPPTVSKFILRAKSEVTVTSNDPQIPGGTQYSNTSAYYFAFVTEDTGEAGLASFTFTEGSAVSPSIPVAGNPGTQGTGDVKVSNVTVANTASGTLVMGYLTVSNTSQGVKSVSLKVMDKAGNVMLSGLSNDPATNRCIYDSLVPTISSVNVIPSSGSYHVYHDVASGNFYTNDEANSVVVIASDGSGDVSGLKCANLGVITTGAFSSIPSSVNFASTTATVPIVLTPGNGQKFLSIAAEDNAGNASGTQTINLYYDSISPTVSMDVLDANGTSLGTLPVGSNDLIIPHGANPLTTFKVRYAASDNYSGLVNPGTYEVFKRSGGSDTTCSITGSCLPTEASSAISIPDSTKSATYIVYLSVSDKVQNTTVKKYGFFYDAKDPVIATSGAASAVRVLIDNAGSTVAKYLTIGSVNYFVVPVMAFPGAETDGTPDASHANYPLYVYLQATDKPADDPDGSGIATISDAVTETTTSGSYIPSTVNASSAEATGAVVDRYVLLKSSSTDYWNYASDASIAYVPTVKDAIGRSSFTTVQVLVDDTLPSASINGIPWVPGYDSSVNYISNTATLDFTPNDTTPNSRPASGLKGYNFGTSETLPAEGDSWTLASGGTAITGNTAFRAVVPTGTPANVYLYLCDNAGNRSKVLLSSGKLKRDVMAPTFTAANVDIKDAAGNPGYVSGSKVFVPTASFTVKATANDRDVDTTGSGIDRFVFHSQKTAVGGVVSPITYVVMADKMDGLPVEVHPTQQTDLASIISLQFYIEAVDKVENARASATGFADANAPTISMDTKAPACGTCSTDGVVSGVINVSDTTILTMPALDSADTDGRPASGIKAWCLSNVTTKPSAPTGAVLPSSATAGPALNTWYAWTGGASQAVPAAFKQIVTDGAGSTNIFAYVVDNVGNVSDYHDAGETLFFVKDTTPPGVDITTATKFAGGTGGTGYFVKGDAKITFTGFDASSGLYQYLISSATYTTGAEIDAAGANAYDAKTNLDVHGYFSDSSATTVYLYVSDKAGNLTKVPLVRSTDGPYSNVGLSPTGAVAAQLDISAPDVTSVSLNNGDAYDNDKIVSVKINLNAADSSGVKTIKLSHTSLSTDTASIAVMANGTTVYPMDSRDTSVAGVITITLTTPCAESGYITVSGVKVTSLEGDTPAITAQLSDAATNGPSVAKYDSITFDTMAPVGGPLTLVDPTPTATGWTNTDKVNLTIPQSDAVSHVRTIEVSGDVLASLSGVTVKVGGSIVGTDSISSRIVRLSAVATSGSAITIEGLPLTSGSGKKDITVKLTDDAGNESSPASASIKYDDTVPDTPNVTVSPTGTYPQGSTYYLSGLTATIALAGAETANGDVSSGLDHFYYTVDSGTLQTPVADGSLSVFTAGDSEGLSKVYHFFQLDKAGNLSTTSNDVTFVKDKTGPSITSSATTPTAGTIGVKGSAYYAQGAKITIAASDSSTGKSGVASYAISTATSAAGVSNSNSLNTGGNGRTNWTGSSMDVVFTPMLNGLPLNLYVWDNLGNTSSTPIVYSSNGSLPWNKDTDPPTSISLTPNGTQGAGFYPTSVSGTSYNYDANGPMTFTLKGTDAMGVTCSVNPAVAPGSPTQSGNEYTWNSLTIPANGTTYTITLSDGIGNSTTLTVKVTLDNTPPSFGTWSMSNSGSTINLSNIVTNVSDVASEIVDGSTVTPSNSLANLSYDSMHTITLTDAVGNSRLAYFVGVYESSTNIVLRIDDSPLWKVVDGTDTTISNLGIYRSSNNGTLTATCVDAATTTTAGTVDVGNSKITGFPLSHGSYYTLSLSYNTSPVKKISFNFSVSGAAASPHAMVFGNTSIGARLADATVVSTIRKQSFDLARTSSRTNLPVWYTDVGKDDTAAKTERSVTAAVTANKSVAQNLASPARANTTLSVEALHAAALSGMKATSANSDVSSLNPVKTVKANETMDFDDTVVMTAPEGSPAFVAYARGLAALRSVQDGSVAVTATRASFSISEGEKPVTVWEKLLAFFGIHDKEDHSEGEVVGFVSN